MTGLYMMYTKVRGPTRATLLPVVRVVTFLFYFPSLLAG